MSKKNTAARVSTMAAPLIDIGIKGKDREKIVQGLSRVLADTYTLYLKTHNFHWNVEGPMFNTLHLMFMDQYTELWNALDLIAERIRALGYPAPGTVQGVLEAHFHRGNRGRARGARHGAPAGRRARSRGAHRARGVPRLPRRPATNPPATC